MSWTVYPAIDLKSGKCVRLYQGDYSKETNYGNPLQIAKKWESEGAAWLHIVDLDGAKSGEPIQIDIVKEIVNEVSIPVQIGGGIRNIETVERYLSIGVKRIIIGTAAIKNSELVKEALKLNNQAIAVGIDARDGYVATDGWLDTSRIKAVELAQKLTDIGATTFIFTDIAKDGTLSGPNIEAVQDFAVQTKAEVIASGGVSSLEDVNKLKELEPYGVKGVIVGKALYSGNISLKAALM